jgi:predicted ATPase
VLIEALSNPFSSTYALNYIAGLYQFHGDSERALACAEASMVLCRANGFEQLLGAAIAMKGWALSSQGRLEEVIILIEQGMQTWAGTGAKVLMPLYAFMLADACTRAGQLERALALVDDTLAEMAERNERRVEPELHRLRGDLLQMLGADDASVEACYQRALDVARKQQAKLLELRAAVRLSRLWQQQGRSPEARKLLAGVYGRFTEGFDTLDLQEAKMLLDELS